MVAIPPTRRTGRPGSPEEEISKILGKIGTYIYTADKIIKSIDAYSTEEISAMEILLREIEAKLMIMQELRPRMSKLRLELLDKDNFFVEIAIISNASRRRRIKKLMEWYIELLKSNLEIFLKNLDESLTIFTMEKMISIVELKNKNELFRTFVAGYRNLAFELKTEQAFKGRWSDENIIKFVKSTIINCQKIEEIYREIYQHGPEKVYEIIPYVEDVRRIKKMMEQHLPFEKKYNTAKIHLIKNCGIEDFFFKTLPRLEPILQKARAATVIN